MPYLVALVVQPVAAVLVVTSFFVPTGVLAGLLVSGWLLFTGLVALFGLVRLLPRGMVRADEACIDAGLLYLPVGAVWLLLYRFGAHPLGFVDTIVLLTAVHFHYAGFAAPILAGFAGRKLAEIKPATQHVFRLVAMGLILGTPLTALGITFSPLLELAAALMLITSLLVLSFLSLFVIVPHITHRTAQSLLIISALSFVVAMLFAGAYAVGQFKEVLLVSIPGMVHAHGWLNALGSVCCGLLAWTILKPKSKLPPPGIPFSSLSSRGRVGPDFLNRISAIADSKVSPLGLVDDLAEYRRLDFNPDDVHPAIRSFYEETARYELLVHPDWGIGFRFLARIFKCFSSRVEQMNFPLHAESAEDLIDSRLLPIHDAVDGRTNVRAWIRTYAKTGKAIYVALYATHSLGTQTYMNIAFPLPGGNLTSILRIQSMAAGEGPSGVLLTTRHLPDCTGDEGIYFVNSLLPIRLPMNETIRVWAVVMPGVPIQPGRPGSETATVVARHDMWLFGTRFLTLDYYIFPRKTAT